MCVVVARSLSLEQRVFPIVLVDARSLLSSYYTPILLGYQQFQPSPFSSFSSPTLLHSLFLYLPVPF